MGAVLTRRGKPEDALEYLENSELIFNELGAQSFMPSVHRRQAAAYLALGELAKAEGMSQEALNLAKELSMRQEEGAALRILGVVYREKGDANQSIDYLERSILMFHEAGIQYEEARSRYELAIVRYQEMQYAQIQPDLDGAIESFNSIGAEVDLLQAEDLKRRITSQVSE